MWGTTNPMKLSEWHHLIEEIPYNGKYKVRSTDKHKYKERSKDKCWLNAQNQNPSITEGVRSTQEWSRGLSQAREDAIDLFI